MKKLDIKKLAGVGTLSIGLVFGMAGFAGAEGASGMIDTTGPYSENEIKYESDTDLDIDNDNDVDLTNTTSQTASSGDATAQFSTTAGDAMSGDAMNSNEVMADVTLDNSSASAWSGVVGGGGGSATASIENTGSYSQNEVKYDNDVDVDINNDNDVDIRNTVSQSATTGDATVQYNTTGGDAVSGNASNTSTSSFTVHVTN